MKLFYFIKLNTIKLIENQNNDIFIIFIDFKKAYDTINLIILFNKLESLKL